MTTPTPFLRLVSDKFKSTNLQNLHKYCFIFPNRRSCAFFEKELFDSVTEPFISPLITTITDFLSDLTQKVECGKIQLLLELYKAYTEITTTGDNFDNFAYWGDVIINDFNDVDRYLVDPESLFRNLKELNEIGSNYLTDEQIAVVKEFFGKDINNSNESGFWKHVNENPDSEIVSKYVGLWNIMLELYNRFNENLANLKLAYSGHIYREAVDKIDKLSPSELPFEKYIFVGFNVLSTSEKRIFTLLKNKGVADFYWDCNSPVLAQDNIATKFLKSNMKQFKPQMDLNEPPIPNFPDIHVLALPSDIGQAKYTSVIIEDLIKQNEIGNIDNPIDTSIVLPEEELFVPLITSITDDIKNLNVTMGYPLKDSSISVLMSGIANMHKQARYENDECKYYHEDVRNVLSHPFLREALSSEIEAILSYIEEYSAFYVPANIAMEKAPSLKCIFSSIKISATEISKIDNLIEYVENILQLITANILQKVGTDNETVEIGFIHQYIESYNQLKDVIKRYDNINMNDDTFFFLIDRFISSQSVAFEGKPLNGLQVMGILETRCLDFKNLIVLSMNEGIYPRKHFSKSFIPYELRMNFDMATMEHQECIYAYYFYRMISRAKNVYLLYDARARENTSGEPSRYIQQLMTLYDNKIKSDFVSFNLQSSGQTVISVDKTERIMNILNQYRSDGDDRRYLSASAINTFINCPLLFYFEKIEKMDVEDEQSEFMDYSTFGTIIHGIMKDLYPQGQYVDKNYIDNIRQQKKEFLTIVNNRIRNLGEDQPSKIQLPDEQVAIIQDIAVRFIDNILSYDELKPFTIVQCEVEEKGKWDLGDGLDFNFKQFIDRVDCTQTSQNNTPLYRIIDYKTGKDETSTGNVADLFNENKTTRAKAILQTFLYCNFFAQQHNYNAPIQPLIYKIKKMNESEIKIENNVVTNYLDYNDSFMQEFKSVIASLFDSQTPFIQAKKNHHCEFCKFKVFCRK